MLRIGFDAKRLFNNFTGLGNYSRTLLANLATYYPEHAYFLYTPKVKLNEETHFFLNSALFNTHLPRPSSPFWWRSFGVNRELRKHKIQLYHGLSHQIPYGLAKNGMKSIVTIHDLIFKRYPSHYSPFDRQVYELKFSHACKEADHIVAISECTKQDIISFYKIPEEKITVIYQSCHERYMHEKTPTALEAVRLKYQLPENYLLTVGSINERKNLLGMVKAIELLAKDQRLPLVVIGQGRSYKKKVQQYIRTKQLTQWVYFLDVDFDDLPALYQNADLFLYPSYFEGFGIPILEALFSKTPVITSNISSLPEAGGPATTMVNPSEPAAIAEAIERVLEDKAYRDFSIIEGYKYAQKFKGEPLTHQMMALYEQVLGQEYITSQPIT